MEDLHILKCVLYGSFLGCLWVKDVDCLPIFPLSWFKHCYTQFHTQ